MFIALVVIVIAAVSLGLLILARMAKAPASLGVDEGKLRPCPESPNCVSSQAEDSSHRIEPIGFDGSPEEARDRLLAVLAGMPRCAVIRDEGGYIHAEVRSRLFGFVDDLEFYIDSRAGVIQVRSASRAGYWDMGVNRKRVQSIRLRYTSLNLSVDG
jgi:uncharacterized protein (DUF1499 family)